MNAQREIDIAAAPPSDSTALRELYLIYNENTEKLRAAFESLERRFREIDPCNIYNSINEGLVTLDDEENILTFNKAAERIFGLPEQEAVGKSIRAVLPRCEAAFAQYRRGDSSGGRYEIAFKNGKNDPVYLKGRFSPLLDRQGAEIGTACLFTDLSIERLLEEKARRSDRLTALGELAAGVAHEMRNPLTTIRGYLQILPDNKDDEDFIKEFSSNLIREIDRLTRLTDDLLNMAKPISPELQRERLSDLAASVGFFLSDKFESSGTQLIVEEDRGGDCVLIDRDRIKQVFINLYMNAIEAMREGGEIRVRFSRRTGRLSEEEKEKVYAVAEVIDNGPGISSHVLDRLFDPFFTTKESGTGLGLSLSHRIVEEHGGFLRVESRAGEGACFGILLPLAAEKE
ncbi:MAG: ATP-binding protein [Candidatus Omnitrophota bacterium]